MTIVIEDPISKNEEFYYFEDKRANDYGFEEKFRKSYEMKKNYNCLKKTICFPYDDNHVEEHFVIYDIDLLSKEFSEAFKLGMNNRWNPFIRQAYDPALTPSLAGDVLVTQEDLRRIQKSLVAVFHEYGEEGLKEVRRFNLAQSLMTRHYYIPITDLDDCYDLPTLNNPTEKLLVLIDLEFDPVKRTLDVLSSEELVSCKNENIKSALFAMPYLLYREGKWVGDGEIKLLIAEILSRISMPSKNELDADTYEEIVQISNRIFVQTYESLFPRKAKEKQYKIGS